MSERTAGRWLGRWVVSLGVVAAVATTSVASAASDPTCFTSAMVPTPGTAVMRLPRSFLRAGSDSVWSRAGQWEAGRDYRLDRLSGDLRLIRAIAPGETVWVHACALLEPPPLDYVRQVYRPARPPGAAPDSVGVPLAPVPRPVTGRDVGTAPAGTSLGVNGNKTIAVDFGSSQDAALRQSLDLSVTGTLAPGVELTGVLTDRDTPVGADGTTQDLRSLDRVLVELRAPDGRGSLGDIPVQVTRGEFARLDRRVQGVSGEWSPGDLTLRGAAAGAQGEYTRVQFNGVDGQQGPYVLPGRDGGTGVSVVPGSEIVTVDGQRMTRGEAADYAIDYDRARITFSNRRLISSASRITVEYQFSLVRFRRNLAAGSSEWNRGRWAWYAHGLRENDDPGRPLSGALDGADRIALALAGDSLALGLGAVPGVGDYDTVRVASGLVFAFAGLDSGSFVVRFARVGEGLGDYADSALVGGRTIYRHVGQGFGAYRIGRLLPAPEARTLGAFGTAVTAGVFRLEAEGALSSLDRNTLSANDDQDNTGGAGRLALSSEGTLPFLAGRVGASAAVRNVESRFSPFSRLERPFAEEDWGLRPGSDLEHQKRGDAKAWWRPGEGREFAGEFSRLATPDGYDGLRREVGARWGQGALAAQALWLEADGEQSGLVFPDGGRSRALAEVRWRGAWAAPMLRAERDRRRTPGDTAATEDRVRSLDADLGTGTKFPFRAAVGAGVRTDQRDAGLTETRSRTQSWRAELETPVRFPLGAVLLANRRDTRDEATDALVRQDLASVRLRGDWRPKGLSGALGVERTGEAENRRERVLTFVGAGNGNYDATGNFVGPGGDHALVLVVSPDLERFARTATSARASWAFGTSETWRGSRVEFTLEDEARRRGEGRLSDVFLSPGVASGDTAIARGAIAQRLEAELAPGSRAAALKLRAERRVNADRSFQNFAQTTDLRSGSLRWRARPAATASAEAEGRVTWQRATQAQVSGGSFERTLVEQAGTAQWIWQPDVQWKVAAALEAAWARTPGQTEATRTLRIGPDLGAGVGRAGRAELTVRRAFVSGPPALGLLPSVDPAGAPRWEGTARFDYRVHSSTTIGFDTSVRERPGRKTVVTGRAEVRAFF